MADRQHACSNAECQAARRKKTQANWRGRHPDYARGHRIEQRAAAAAAPEPLRLQAPLDQLPWDLVKDQFGAKATDFIGIMGSLIIRSAKDQFRAYVVDSRTVPGTLLPPAAKDQIAASGILIPTDATGIYQLDRPFEHLRVRHPERQRRLLASLADAGQQMPIVVVAAADNGGRYLVIDGYKRIQALQQLGKDTVEVVVWPMSEAEALVLDR